MNKKRKKRTLLSQKLLMLLSMLLTILSLNTRGQAPGETKVSVRLKASRLDAAMLQLKNISPVNIAYDAHTLNLHQWTIGEKEFKDASLSEILQYLLRNTTITYETISGGIVLVPARKTGAPAPKKDPGRVAGRILDEDTGEPVPGVTVQIGGRGITTDIDGLFSISLPQGDYEAEISSVGYGKKIVTDIRVKEGSRFELTVALKREKGQLSAVVVKAPARKESVAALYARQKNAPVISDGISAEQIGRTPDKNMGEVMRRVSGVSVVDNRFLVIRGLSERYNGAMVNGQLMPSTELNRKQFSLDIIPSGMVENTVVYKTVTPDMSAEFGGGLVNIVTRSIPAENFLTISAGGSYNDNTTGKDFATLKLEGREYLARAASHRNLFGKLKWNNQEDILKNAIPPGAGELNGDYTVPDPSRFANNWGLYRMKASPSQNYQLSLGRVYTLANPSRKIGFIGSLSYRNTFQTQDVRMTRNNFSSDNSSIETFRGLVGKRYGFTTNLGALAGVGYSSERTSLSFQTLYLQILDQQLVLGTGSSTDPSGYMIGYYDLTTQTALSQNTLKGEHLLGKHGSKLQWNLNYTYLDRQKPDNHNMKARFKEDWYDKTGELNLTNSILGQVHGGGAARIWNRAVEKNFSWGADYSHPFTIDLGNERLTNTFKGGFAGWRKDRFFYILGMGSKSGAETARYPALADLFDPANGTTMYISRFFDQFNKQADLHALYTMMDNKLGRWRLVWGLRAEYFDQNAASQVLEKTIESINQSRPGDEQYDFSALYNREKPWKLFPSANLTYGLTSKMNLRLAYSRSIIRPDLRELSYLREYDFELGGEYEAKMLRSTIINNVDFRYEWYPGPGEVLSFSLFYKKLSYPMEIYQFGGVDIYQLKNDKDAENKGLEIEIRKSLAFTGVPVLRDITLYGNFTYLDSWVRPMEVNDNYTRPETPYKLEPVEIVKPKEKRPQMGASNYIYNASLYYDTKPVSLTTSYNFVTNRTFRPTDPYKGSLFERPLESLDGQLAFHLLHRKADLRLSVTNLLNSKSLVYSNFYTDGTIIDPSKSELMYNESQDLIDYEARPGRTYSISFSYTF